MKTILVITHTAEGGLNFRQAMECLNLIGSNYNTEVRKNPMSVSNEDLKNADFVIMIVPEWNGSFPFSFKELIDASGYPSRFSEKRILLIGTSNTSFGNIMGITHLQHILNWIGANVYHKRICVPHIDKKFEHNNIKVDERLRETLSNFVNNF
jgi:chromate reductase